jgi:hypothetical protein
MKVKQAIDVIEEATKLALLDVFPDDEATIAKINEAFKVGAVNAVAHLRAAFGNAETARFLESLHREMGKESSAHQQRYFEPG